MSFPSIGNNFKRPTSTILLRESQVIRDKSLQRHRYRSLLRLWTRRKALYDAGPHLLTIRVLRHEVPYEKITHHTRVLQLAEQSAVKLDGETS